MKTKCKIDSREEVTTLVYLGIDTDIERKDAEEIVKQFKDNKYVSANIFKRTDYDVFEVVARSPKVSVDCRKPEEKQYILMYSLGLSQLRA